MVIRFTKTVEHATTICQCFRGVALNCELQGELRCLIPCFDGVILSLEWKEALWDKFVTGAPRPRTPSEQQYSDPLPGRVMRSMIPRGASFDRGTEPRAWDQSEDGGQVAQASDGRGSEDRAQRPALDCSKCRRRGHGCRVPSAHFAAVGRLPLRFADIDPSSDAIFIASLSSKTWNIAFSNRESRRPSEINGS